MCVSLAAGATFALFTSQSKVNITVSSGKVQVLAEITDFSVYSPTSISTDEAEGNPIVDAKNAATEVTQDGTVYSGIFYNKGTATLDTAKDAGAITLNNMTPGDKVTFTLTLKNESNVKVKYRTTVAHGENSATDLLKALVFNIGGITVESSTIWKSLDPADSDDDKNIAVYECSIELPTSVNNDYQDKSCEIYFLVEAIQGNAETVDATAKIATMASVAVSSINTETQTEQTAEGEKTYLVTKTSLDITSKDSVPASDTQTVAVAKAVIPEGAKLEETATQLTLNIYETETPSNFKVEDGKNAKALEVEMKGLSSDNTQPIKVTMFVGKNLENLTLTHITADGTKTKMTSVTELDKVVKDKFYYDSTTGLVTMATATFSPFVCSFDAKLVSTAEEFIEALKDSSLKTIKLNADIEIDPKYNVNNRLNVETDGLTIDLNGHTLTARNCALTITGDNVTIKNGKMVASNNGSYTMMIKGKNVTVDKITMTGGVNVSGSNSSDTEYDAIVNVNNCNITATGYYTVCAQDNSSVTIKNSTLTRGNGACFWVAKKGHTENDEPDKCDSYLAYEHDTVTINNSDAPLYDYNTVGVAPIELHADNQNVTWAHDVYTLKKALADTSVAKIILSGDINLDEVLDVKHSVTIDFCGKTIKAEGNEINDMQFAIDIVNNPTSNNKLTFKDSVGGGVFYSTYGGIALWSNRAQFELNDVTIKSDNGYAVEIRSYSLILDENYNYVDEGEISGASIVINSGKIITPVSSKYSDGAIHGGSNTITDGNRNKVVINGGEFEIGDVYCGIYLSEGSDLTINDGKFTISKDNKFHRLIHIGNKNATAAITGGTFNVDPSAYLAEGYKVEEVTIDDAIWYKVVAKSANEG